jgi:argininosuccinate lyase
MLESIEFKRERMAEAASDEFIAATDVADLLVRRGVPFREAHGIVGGVVRAAVERGKKLSELSEDELMELAPQLDGQFYELLDEDSVLESKVSDGGTAMVRVRDQLAQARQVLRTQVGADAPRGTSEGRR